MIGRVLNPQFNSFILIKFGLFILDLAWTPESGPGPSTGGPSNLV